MKSHISLSRYDEKFIDSISILSQVTTNQVILFHTLLDKYRRQFAKHEIDVEDLYNLEWNVKIVESIPKYTNGHITIENDTIHFRCPFNRNFIDTFRKEPNNKFLFNKETRQYEAPFNQYSLKILINSAAKFFNDINLCPETTRLLENIHYCANAKYWNPKLVRLNGRLYIVGMNSALNDALGDIDLNTDPDTLAALASYGIEIDSSLYEDTFANRVKANSQLKVEHFELKELVGVLQELNCDMVYMSGAGVLNLAKKKLVELLTDAGIEYTDLNTSVPPLTKYNFPVAIRLRDSAYGAKHDPYKVCKSIHIVNSLPITIK
jgi:hypothetical protein